MDGDFVRKRITQLRMKKNVSEYRMSLDMGHGKNYIQTISSGRSIPSMGEFLYICEYFGITPSEFFNEEYAADSVAVQKALDGIRKLDYKDLELLIQLIERLNERK